MAKAYISILKPDLSGGDKESAILKVKENMEAILEAER